MGFCHPNDRAECWDGYAKRDVHTVGHS